MRPASGKFPRRVMAVVTVVAGLLGGSLFTRWFDHAPAAQAPVLPTSVRRRPRVRLEVRAVAPDGLESRQVLSTPLGAATLGSLDIDGRRLEITLSTGIADRLRATAQAQACGRLSMFCAEVEEDVPALWRLPVADGLATLRVRLTRDYG